MTKPFASLESPPFPASASRSRTTLQNNARVLFIHGIVTLFMGTQVFAATYVLEHKSPASRPGAGLSIAVDGSGNPHLAYNRAIDLNGSFRHAYKQSGVWHYNTIVDRSANYSSLAFNNGVLYGSYQDALLEDCRFATYSGSNWTTELVWDAFPVEGVYTSLAFDQAGEPHIAFHEGSGADNANHAFRGLGGWIAENAAGNDINTLQGLYTSIALSHEDTIFISHVGVGAGGQFRPRLSELSTGDWQTVDISSSLTASGLATSVVATPVGQPLVAFVGDVGPTLYFAERTALTTWTITPVDTLGDHSDLEMQLDTFGQPHIAYRKGLELRHAYRDIIQGWRRETVDAPTLGLDPILDLAIDGTNTLHIGYRAKRPHPNGVSGVVYYAVGSFGNWSTEHVEGEEDEGAFLAATTTSAGEPIVAFYNATLADLQVGLRIQANNWLQDDIADLGDVGRFVSMTPRVPASGLANVAYFDATNGTIVQSSGSSDLWTRTTVASVPALAGLSYADSAGFGRIAYYDSLVGDLFLARLGPGGTSIVPVDQAGDVGRSCSIRVTANGETHIAYHDATVGRLRHARFVGGGWSYLTIATGAGIGRTCVLAADGNALGGAYYDPVNGDLHWARWDGTTWTTGLVDAANDVGSSCSVALGFGSVLDIAYYDATSTALKFARVTSLGTVAFIDIVDTGNVGRPNAIMLHPTTAAVTIAYYDATVRQIKYARQNSATTDVDDYAGISAEVVVSPNPARLGQPIRVSMSGGARPIRSVALYDVRGRELSVSAPVHSDGEVRTLLVPSTTSGVLYVRVIDDRGLAWPTRIVVLQ